ncbi:hypothetical protein DPMN_075962 [Dreissena polymorpha]|uniref:Uncharacterized protein n=1 Tax=Dreissena polymorpha TaxID=45954 RepID=A0A9D3YHY9_DREPO|nr:hypothetical protein DPMN_075962 [Dreissena polymorpha]
MSAPSATATSTQAPTYDTSQPPTSTAVSTGGQTDSLKELNELFRDPHRRPIL